MNQTKIQLIGTNAGFLDLKDNTAAPLTLAIADIKDLSKKKGTFSKSITLSGTKNNNILLGNYFDVNIQAQTFDVNKIVECNIIQNGVPVLSNGILQLVSVNKNQKNGNYEDEITYTVLVKDNTSDFFTQINNKELTDLSGFTWMRHTYNADTVIASFNNTIADGYKYIMPYTPEGQTTLDDASLDLTEFSPGIYAKIYFDKIFQAAGYSYSWPDMDSNDVNFSKLIIPFNGEKPVINAVETLDYTAEVENSSPQTISTRTRNVSFGISNRYEIEQGTTDRVNMTVEISDPSNNWNSLFSKYTPPNLASNQNSIEIEYELDWELVTQSFGNAYLKNYNTSSMFDFNVIPNIKMRRQGTAQILANTIILDNGQVMDFEDGTFISNGTNVVKSGTTTFVQLAQGIDPSYGIEVASNVTTTSGWMFKATDNIAGTNQTNTSFGLRIVNIRAKIKTMVEGTYGYGIPVDMNRYVPQKVKQSDYIKSIFTMFNIFAEVDKDNSKKINLVSRDKYYDDGKINDWTSKLDKKQSQEIKFLPELSSKSMILTYKEDSDISNKVYKEAVGEIYGQQKFTFDNEFVRDEKKTEIIFSPTPIFNTKFGAVCPMWLGGAPKCNLRILYDGGQYSCDNYSIVNYRLNSGTINQVSATTYPYVGHWDKPDNPTFDLNFGVCDYYFRSDDYGALTNNNLFNLHWRRTLNQINSGKLMTAYFNLNETDILNLSLNDKIRIDNSWWNINKVQDYDANSNKPTKVELISIDDTLKIPFQKRARVKLVRDLSTDLIGFPVRQITIDRNKFLTVNLSSHDIEVKGKYNYITENVTSATIVGDGNLISENSTVYGNNNIIASEVTIYGDNNIATEESNGSTFYGNYYDGLSGNTIYTNNIIISSGGTINGTPVIGIDKPQYVLGYNDGIYGNVINNQDKGPGTITFTSGSTAIIGNGVDFTDDTNKNNPFYWYTVTVKLADGTYVYIELDSYTDATNGTLLQIYSDNQSENLISYSWPYSSGDYQYWVSFISSANGFSSHAEGFETQANGSSSHSEGFGTQANNFSTHAEGQVTIADGYASHAEGSGTLAAGEYSHAEGQVTIASGTTSHAEGISTLASGTGSHAEGFDTFSFGIYSHAQGNNTQALGESSHSEGFVTIASGTYSHAEGENTIASGDTSHAEGYKTKAYGESSHSEGDFTIASGTTSHAEGVNTIANGDYSHAGGVDNTSNSFGETVIGHYALPISGDSLSINSGDTIFRVGIGSSTGSRKDGFTVFKNGAIQLTPVTTASITTPQSGMFIYDTTGNLNIYNGSSWNKITSEISNYVMVESLSDLPSPVSSVITLGANITYFITTTIDLVGNRLVGGANTTILGASSENSILTSTGLGAGVPLFTSIYTTPIRHISIKDVDTALDFDGTTNPDDMALDFTGINFVNVPNIGTVKKATNFVYDKGAFLNSKGLKFDGTCGTVALNNSLFSGDGLSGSLLEIKSSCTITRRFRVIYSSVVATSGTIGITVSTGATIPNESYILDTINFAGGGTYTNGVGVTDNKTLFINCKGISNTAEISQYYMNNNTTTTPITIVSTPVKVSGTTSSSSITQKFTNTNNRGTYNGSLIRFFKVSATLSIESGNNNQIGCYIAKNGTILSESEVYITTNGSGRAEGAKIQTLVELTPNDYIEIFVENATTTNNILVTDMNVIID